MSEGEKEPNQADKKKPQDTGLGPWDAARTAPMRELAKGTKGDPFELGGERSKEAPKKKQD